VSAWVKCAAPFTWAGGLGWGAAGDVQGSVSPQVAALSVTSGPDLSFFVVSTLAGTNQITGTANGQGAAARFNNPRAVAVDSAGNVYVADQYNNMIRKISPSRTSSTIATGYNHPTGIAVDVAGNVYAADSNNCIIRLISAGGTLAYVGTAGSCGYVDGGAAKFNKPQGVAVDTERNLYVADTDNHVIRKVTPTGSVSTLAGSQTCGSVDGTGTAARFLLSSKRCR
jgi:streptogramin lyase